MKNAYVILPALLAVAACSGTGAEYSPILDGAPRAGYQDDLTACQQTARQRDWIDTETREDAVIGAVVGAAIGAAEDGPEGAIGGLIGGAMVGTADGAITARDDRKDIVIACMKGRGHKVVG